MKKDITKLLEKYLKLLLLVEEREKEIIRLHKILEKNNIVF